MTYPLPVPGRDMAQLKRVTLANNQAVKVITLGNKAVLCCKHEDLKNMSFKSHGSSYCCIPNCRNFRGKVPNMSFFQFPKDVGRCKTWVSFTTRDDLKKKDCNALSRSGFAICASHFEDSMFMNSIARNRLIHCAVPTIFDPSRPPPPASIKELAARFSDNVHDNPQLSLEEDDLCVFHRKFMKAVTFLEMEICDVRYCMICGSCIEEVKEVASGTYQAVCSRRHSSLFTTEFSSKCREWVTNCHNLDRIKEVANFENRCHLCEEHFREPSDPTTTLMNYDDMQSNLAASELPFPSVEEVTITTTPAPGGAQYTLVKKSPTKSAMLYPSLPSCFFTLGGFTTRLDKILGENMQPVQSVKCQFSQTNIPQKPDNEINLNKTLKNCRAKICRLKKRIAALENQLKRPPVLSAQILSQELPKYLKGACLLLIQEQLKVSKTNCRGVRWSEDFLLLAKIILRESDQAYSILKRIMMLPTMSTIRRHKAASGELPSLEDYLKSAFPPGNTVPHVEMPGLENGALAEDSCADDMEIDESECGRVEIGNGEGMDSAEELLISTEDGEVPVEEQSVEVQVLQQDTCLRVLSHEGIRIYEMYAEAAAALQNDAESIALNGEDTAVTIINVIPASD